MSARIIDGRELAQRLQSQLAQDVIVLRERSGVTPRLAALLAGDDPASAQYVRMKRRACQRVGIESQTQELDAGSSQAEVEAIVGAFNEDHSGARHSRAAAPAAADRRAAGAGAGEP